MTRARKLNILFIESNGQRLNKIVESKHTQTHKKTINTLEKAYIMKSDSGREHVRSSDIPVLEIISVLVFIKFELNHVSISFYTASELFSVLVSIKFLEIISVSVFTSFQ